MNTENNLHIYNQVKETDPKHTKRANQRGGYTSVSPQYQIQEATRVFGPYGDGWGFESIDLDLSFIDSLGVVMVKAVFFYKVSGEIKRFPINNSWSAKMGSRVDIDFAKKAETNTTSKALSKLGFSSDVYLGEFDDPNYVENIGNKKNMEAAEDKIEEQAKQDKEWSEWKQKELAAYDMIPNVDALKAVFTGHMRKIKLRDDEAAIRMFTLMKDQRKKELEK